MSRWSLALVLFLLLNAVALWIVSMARFDRTPLASMGDLGLVPLLPPIFFAALGVLTVSFAIFVTRRNPPATIAILHFAVLVAVWHVTPAILYGTPRYPYAYKHIGVGEYIQRLGSIDPHIDAYFNWPGFFALNALVSDLAGLASPQALAVWAPVALSALTVAALVVLMRALTNDPRWAWLAVWLYLLTNWVGQDYYAPQALAYALHIALLAAFVGALGTRPRSPARRATALALIVMLFGAIVAMHQLTPFVTLASILVLTLTGFGSPRSLPIVLIAMIMAWFTYMTQPYLAGHLGELLASVGRLFDNINQATRVLASAGDIDLSPDRRLVLDVRQWLTLLLFGVAILGGIRRVRRGFVDWTAIILLLVPASMIALQPYGGEIIMRVYLFSLPFLVWFAAAVVFPTPESGRHWAAPVVIGVMSAVAWSGSALAFFGNESMNYIAPAEITAFDVIYDEAPTGSLVIAVTNNAPVRYRRYEQVAFTDLSAFARETGLQDVMAVDALASGIEASVEASDRPAAYVVFTRSQAANARLFGLLPDVDLDELAERMQASSRFEAVLRNEAAAVFALVRPAEGTP